MSATALALAVAAVILGALAALQLAVACSAPLARFVWGGSHRVLPPRLRIASAASIVLYAGFAWVLADRAELWGTPTTFSRIAAWVLFGYFCLGILMNAVSRSRAERFTMTPTCAVLAAASLVIALS